MPHDDASVWLTNLHVQNCVAVGQMCENHGKDDAETDNNSLL